MGDILIAPAANLASHCGIVETYSKIGFCAHLTAKDPGMHRNIAATDVFKGAEVFRRDQLDDDKRNIIAEAIAFASDRVAWKLGPAAKRALGGNADPGPKAKKRLDEMEAMLEGDAWKEATKLPVVCSGFVVVCYWIAAFKMNNVLWAEIELDYARTLPKDLRNYLITASKNGGTWLTKGELTD